MRRLYTSTIYCNEHPSTQYFWMLPGNSPWQRRRRSVVADQSLVMLWVKIAIESTANFEAILSQARRLSSEFEQQQWSWGHSDGWWWGHLSLLNSFCQLVSLFKQNSACYWALRLHRVNQQKLIKEMSSMGWLHDWPPHILSLVLNESDMLSLRVSLVG